MKKTTKLLSVLLAMLMILSSLSMLSFAAKAEYQTAQNLEAMKAYSPDGAVTRLSTEERASMVLDFLDVTLKKLNIAPMNMDLKVAKLNVNLQSVNGVFSTIDSVYDIRKNWLVSLASAFSALGVIKDLDVSTWSKGLTREGQIQLYLLFELTEFLNQNRNLVRNKVIVARELNLGLVGNFVDLSTIQNYIKDLPGLIKGLIFPLFERKDDDMTQINSLVDNASGDGKLEAVVDSFVTGLFTKPMSTTTYFEDAAGNCISKNPLPKETDKLRYYYTDTQEIKDENGKSLGLGKLCYFYNTEKKAYEAEEPFLKTEEKDADGNTVYTYRKADGTAIKYYETGSYWLPSLQMDLTAKDISLSTNSAASLLYKFVPYVFQEMAPVVLNGSIKKLVAQWFGVNFTNIGNVVDGAFVPYDEATTVPNDTFFTEPQGTYLWEWSNYKVIDGVHYYRYEDQIFVGSDCNNPYMQIVNWDYNIDGEFLNEFIPAAPGTDTILAHLNDFLVKVANTIFSTDTVKKMGLKTGDNTNLVANIKNAAQVIVDHSPKDIFGSDYMDDGYYTLMMSKDSDQDVLNGLAATIIKLVMKQMRLPSAEKLKGQNVGAILAAVLRELATQLVPSIDYDKLIYKDYNTKTFIDGNKSNSYWLDVCLTIGTDIGYKYLTNLSDMGEDTSVFASGSLYNPAMKYDYAAFNAEPQKYWEAKVDYIVDWALSNEYEWCWSMGNLVNTENLSINLATPEDPWVKIDQIIRSILPVDEVLNVTPANGQTWLETALRDNLVLGLVDLKLEKIVGMLNIPQDSRLRKTNIYTQLVSIVVELLGALVDKVGGYGLFNETDTTSLDATLTQNNIGALVGNLLNMLYNAVTKDFDPSRSGDARFRDEGLLTAALPIVNFFLGWHTDAQTYADPIITLADANRPDLPYIYASGNNINAKLSVTNGAAGMLLRRNMTDSGDVLYDKPYNITIDKIEISDPNVKSNLSTSNNTIAPYATAEYSLTGTWTKNEVLTVVVYYRFQGKTGEALGGQQSVQYLYYISNVGPETEDWGQEFYGDGTKEVGSWPNKYTNSVKNWGYVPAVFATPDNMANAIDSFGFNFENQQSKKATWVETASLTGNDPRVVLDRTFIHGTNENKDKRPKGVLTVKGSNGDTYNDTTIYDTWFWEELYAAENAVFTAGESFKAGTLSVTWRTSHGDNSRATWTHELTTFYCYDVAEVKDAYNGKVSLMRSDFPGATDTLWNAYVTARDEAIRLLTAPKRAATFAHDFAPAYVTQVATALNDAYKNLTTTTAAVIGGDVKTQLQGALDAYATDPLTKADYNFQDYNLYEYWDFENERTTIRNMIKSMTGPAKLEAKRIDGIWKNTDEIDALIADATKKGAAWGKAVAATVITPTAEELAANAKAIADYVPAYYTDLRVDDVTQKIAYYNEVMLENPVGETDMTFLNRELAAAVPTTDEAKYSKYSWANYAAALATAQKVAANSFALPSEVFDAKYALMKAQNELIPVANSTLENGTVDKLAALAKQAETVLDNYGTYFTVKAAFTENDALGSLIKALGYKETDAEGNEAILYSRCAYEFLKYDRKDTAKNVSRINACAYALEQALAKFESAVKLEEKPEAVDEVTVADSDGVTTVINVVDGITPGTMKSLDDLLAKVEVVNADANVKTNYTPSKANTFGTGAVVSLDHNTIGTLNTYYVIIYGDVNGDGAVDGFDALETSLAAAGSVTVDGVYATAGDLDGTKDLGANDYSLIQSVAAGNAVIDQDAGTIK